MASHNPADRGHRARAQMSIPQFEPLPPTSLMNRIINKVLAPLYYLLFSIITAIVVVPVYTIIENFKNGRNSRGGQRVHRNEEPGKSKHRNQAEEFLQGYSSSYGKKQSAHQQATAR